MPLLGSAECIRIGKNLRFKQDKDLQILFSVGEIKRKGSGQNPLPLLLLANFLEQE